MDRRSQALLAQAHHEAARASWLMTAPNPRVGALALAQGHVIGRGHHAAWGGPHAEEAALRDAGAWDFEANAPIPGLVDEMVVSLEPCSATGKKRPPCSSRLIEAGVKKLTVAALDPDPRHAGAGLERLREQGIEVQLGPDAEQCSAFTELNPAFLRGLAFPERPWILLKWAASLDGKIAAENGTSQWITNESSRAEVHRVRACCDAVLCGAGTLLADNPSLTARPEQAPAALRSNPPSKQPLRVLLGGGDRVQADARIFQDDAPRLWVLRAGQEASAAVQESGDPVVYSGDDLSETMQVLRADHGVHRLLVEGGAMVHGALIQAGLVDAILRYEAPKLLGGSRAACAGSSFETPALAMPLEQEERADHGQDLRRAFLVTSGWSG